MLPRLYGQYEFVAMSLTGLPCRSQLLRNGITGNWDFYSETAEQPKRQYPKPN